MTDTMELIGRIEASRGVPDSHWRLLLLNQRSLGVSSIASKVVDGAIRKGKISIGDKYSVIQGFAQDGDPLCGRICDYLDTLRHSESMLVLDSSRIPEKMVTRTMTKGEYHGYLSGELSIGELEGKSYHLPLEESNQEVEGGDLRK